VFAVATHRCAEVFEPPGCVTLWSLPEAIEEEFDTRWEHWLDRAAEWQPFFQKLEGLQGSDLVAALSGFEVISDADRDALTRVRRSAEGRAVPLPGVFSPTNADVTLLALGFARAEVGALAVPYARRGTREGDFARERRLVLHHREGSDDRRNLRGLRRVGLRALEA